jgi:UrcA family protein
MNPSLKWISSLALATAVSLVAFSSNAAERIDADAPTRTVKAWDLDLTNAADVQTLYQRLHAAAVDVCASEAQRHWRNTRERAPRSWREGCVKEAVAGAVREVANPRLLALL